MHSISKIYGVAGNYGPCQKFLCAMVKIQQISSSNNASTDAFFQSTKLDNLKQGRGGRSSFNGNTATIFGATGYIGKYVVNSMAKVGTQIIIPFREPHSARHLKVAGDLGQILLTKLDVEDEDSIRKAVRHSNIVINLIGRNFQTRNYTYERVNVGTAERIARISKEMGVKTFIHVSSLNSDRDLEGYIFKGGSRFLKSKGKGEKLVRNVFPEATIFRPGTLFGGDFDPLISYYMPLIRKTIDMVGIPKGGRSIWKQPLYTGDLAKGIAVAAFDPDASGRIYEAVGPRRYELRDLVNWIFETGYFGPNSAFDMKFDPTIIMRAYFRQFISINIPRIHVEQIELESVSDITTGTYNLDDLGIECELLEDRIVFEMVPFADHGQYYEGGQILTAPPPKYTVPSKLIM